MIDTHTHLYMTDSFPDGGKAAVARAVEEGVDMMVLPAVDRESMAPMIELHQGYPANTSVALGLHPTEVGSDWREELGEIMDHAGEVNLIAIGETGIDLHWDSSNILKQMDSFGEQLQMALEKDLPVIVHSRDALDETIEVVSNFSSKMPTLVFHSFTGGRREADRLLEAASDAFFGVNGVVTFKNAEALREALLHIPVDRIVTETDSPFLAPVPYRGKINESSYIPYIVSAIAGVKGTDEKSMAEATRDNALRLYPKLKT